MRKTVVIAGLFLVVGLVVGRFSTPREAGAADCGEGRVDGDAYCLDADGNGAVELTDAFRILGYLFLGEPTPDSLMCDRPEHDPPHLCQRIAVLEAEVGRLQDSLTECRKSLLVGNPLPATGQTACWDGSGAGGTEADCDTASYPGQDGYYQVGCPTEGRFKTIGDDPALPPGTVLDTCTGLMWTQDAVDVNGDGTVDGSDTATWEQALDACEDSTVAGFEDWRLPNVRELQSIVNFGDWSTGLFAAFEWSPQADWTWTSTSGPVANAAFAVMSRALYGSGHGVEDSYGPTSYAYKSYEYHVRAVRTTLQTYRRNLLPATGQESCWDVLGNRDACGGDTLPLRDGEVRAGCPREGRFVLDDSGTPDDWNDDTVVDNCTGLEWQRTGETTGDWGHALRYCAGLTIGGKDGWRLPNVAELQSLQDYGSRTGIASEFVQPDGTCIPAFRRWYWSSTTVPMYGVRSGFPPEDSYYYAPAVLFGAWYSAGRCPDGTGDEVVCPGLLDGDGGTRTWNGKDAVLYVRAVRTIQPGE